MALAAWLFALSPNLIAHGTLATMELPLVAATTAMFWFFLAVPRAQIGGPGSGRARPRPAWLFRASSRRSSFRRSLRVVWWVARWRSGEEAALRLTWQVASRMLGFVLLMLLTNLVAHRVCTNSPEYVSGQHPSLEKWLGDDDGPRSRPALRNAAATRLGRIRDADAPPGLGRRQLPSGANGGCRGWWYYYFVALAVKVPLGFWLLVVARLALDVGTRSG